MKTLAIIPLLASTAFANAVAEMDLQVVEKPSKEAVAVVPRQGMADLSSYGEVLISVTNTAPWSFTVHWEACCEEGELSGAKRHVEPYGSAQLRFRIVNLPWCLDSAVELPGVKNAPHVSLRKTFSRFRAFRLRPGREPGGVGLMVLSVRGIPYEGTETLLPAATFFPFVDEFGQFRHAQWEGKVNSMDELHSRVACEDAWLNHHEHDFDADFDIYGGFEKGPLLTATGRFRTEKIQGKWWFVDPDGRLFYSHGIAGVRPGEATRYQGREHFFALPLGVCPQVDVDYAAMNLDRLTKGGRDEYFHERTIRRLKAWGINTIGNWSAMSLCRKRRVPYTVTLRTFVREDSPVIRGAKGKWGTFPDPFAERFIANIQNDAAEMAASCGGDPWCLGWFCDNELPWTNDDRHLAEMTWRSDDACPAKQAFRKWLSAHGNRTEPTSSDMLAFSEIYAERYFRLVKEAIAKVDPDALYLGCRFSHGGALPLRAASKYCDVVSANVYNLLPERKHGPRTGLPEGSIDRPLLVGEFHFGALDRGGFGTGLVTVRSQEEREKCYLDYHTACLKHPSIVGAHWFKWRDQMITGRGLDGENYQIGFVSIVDLPWPSMVWAARKTARLLARGVEEVLRNNVEDLKVPFSTTGDKTAILTEFTLLNKKEADASGSTGTVRSDGRGLVFTFDVRKGGVPPVSREGLTKEAFPEGDKIELFLSSPTLGYCHFAFDYEGRRYEAKGLDGEWSCPWDVKTTRTKDGWSTEVRIPYAPLGLAPQVDPRVKFLAMISLSPGDLKERNRNVCWRGGVPHTPSSWGTLFIGLE